MLDWIKDLIVHCWDAIVPYVIVYPTEKAVVYRLGRLHRQIGCGPHFKIPLIEKVDSVSCVITTMPLGTQTLTTADGKLVVVSSILRYEIEDVLPYFTEIWDSHDVLKDTALGATEDVIVHTEAKDLLDPRLEKEILQRIRTQVKRYGFKVHRFTFKERGFIRSLRLIGNPLIPD